MKFKMLNQNKCVIRLEKGEEIIEALKKVCLTNKIMSGEVRGIGAVRDAELAIYRPKEKKYKVRRIEKNCELLSLIGNITSYNDKPYIHIHVVLADKNFNCIGGHLESGIITATCELVLDIFHEKIEREFNEEVNLKLMKL